MEGLYWIMPVSELNNNKHFHVFFSVKIITFDGEGLSVPRSTPKMADQPLSAIHVCLFSVFTSTLSYVELSP
jgi:hypothetical protein